MVKSNGRQGNNGKARQGNNKANGSNPLKKLRGECEELGSNVFVVNHTRQADIMIKTFESITNYVQRTYTNGYDVAFILENDEEYELKQHKPDEFDFLRKVIKYNTQKIKVTAAQARAVVDQVPSTVVAAKQRSQLSMEAIESIKQGTDPYDTEIEIPIESEEWELTEVSRIELTSEIKNYQYRVVKYDDNKHKLWSLIWGQCTMPVRSKLEARKDWNNLRMSKSPLSLKQAIQEIIFDHKDGQYPIASMYDSLKMLFTMKQEEKEGNTAFQKRFKNTKDIVETLFGPLVPNQYVKMVIDTQKIPKDELDEKIHDIQEETMNRLMAYIYLKGASPKKSTELLTDLGNDMAMGVEKYPKTLEEAVDVLHNFTPKANKGKQGGGSQEKSTKGKGSGEDSESGKAFVQDGKKQSNQDIKCFRCGKRGHIAKNCTAPAPVKQTTNTQVGEASGGASAGVNLHVQAVLSAYDQADDLSDKLLLDNQSTCHIWCRLDLLQNVHPAGRAMNLTTNAGVIEITTVGDIPNFGTVWCDERCITNIISQGQLVQSEKFSLTLSDDATKYTLVNEETGKVTTFTLAPSGLYEAPVVYQVPRETPEAVSHEKGTKHRSVTLVNTVQENKKNYTKRQVKRAEVARALYHTIGCPSEKDFRHIIQTKQISNCPVVLEDVKIFETIYGPDVYALKGKTTQTKSEVVVSDNIEVPQELVEAHKGIKLCADIFFINKVGMLVTISKSIKYGTAYYVKDKTKETLMTALDATFSKYNSSGFEIVEFHADNDFNCIKTELQKNQMEVNICAANEHQPDIERYIRLVKERFRAMYHQLPFKMWTRLMIIRGADWVIKMLNAFPPSGGLSPIYSPLAIIEGKSIDFKKHCSIPFGSYVQALDPTTNTPAERTKDGILLRVLSTQQGGYEMMDLKTGKPFTRKANEVTALPMPPHVIARVQALAKGDGFKPKNTPIMSVYAALTTGVDDEDSADSDAEYLTPDVDDQSDSDTDSEDEPPQLLKRDSNNH